MFPSDPGEITTGEAIVPPRRHASKAELTHCVRAWFSSPEGRLDEEAQSCLTPILSSGPQGDAGIHRALASALQRPIDVVASPPWLVVLGTASYGVYVTLSVGLSPGTADSRVTYSTCVAVPSSWSVRRQRLFADPLAHACTLDVTFTNRHPAVDGTLKACALPELPLGWSFHVTPPSVQAALGRVS